MVEICSPAQHATCIDHSLQLPTNATPIKDREYGPGHQFAHFLAGEEGGWEGWGMEGFEARGMGFGKATKGAGEASVVRVSPSTSTRWYKHCSGFSFFFVLKGKMVLHIQEKEGKREDRVEAGDSFVVPPGVAHRFEALPPPQQTLQLSDQPLELLHCSIPGKFQLEELDK